MKRVDECPPPPWPLIFVEAYPLFLAAANQRSMQITVKTSITSHLVTVGWASCLQSLSPRGISFMPEASTYVRNNASLRRWSKLNVGTLCACYMRSLRPSFTRSADFLGLPPTDLSLYIILWVAPSRLLITAFIHHLLSLSITRHGWKMGLTALSSLLPTDGLKPTHAMPASLLQDSRQNRNLWTHGMESVLRVCG